MRMLMTICVVGVLAANSNGMPRWVSIVDSDLKLRTAAGPGDCKFPYNVGMAGCTGCLAGPTGTAYKCTVGQTIRKCTPANPPFNPLCFEGDDPCTGRAYTYSSYNDCSSSGEVIHDAPCDRTYTDVITGYGLGSCSS